jgi:dihydroorotate dehydrogenase (fumarate)
MTDLSTTYLGLELRTPLIASASPLSKKLDSILRMEDAGVGAVVMYSLFEEQITHEQLSLNHYLNQGTESFAEAITYFPDMENYNVGPESYLELVSKAKESVKIPIIGSLNGITAGGWVNYARKIEQAGADALELNIYDIPSDINLPSSEIEKNYVELVKEVRREIHIPLAVKLSPFFTSLPSFSQKVVQAGANSLVLFNRFIQPTLDIETLEVVPHLELSSSYELLLPLRWVAILYGRIKADFALTGGVHGETDVIRAMMAGANAVMMASELIAHGVDRIPQINADIQTWMEKYEYSSIRQMIGSMSQKNATDPSAFERANYMKALTSYDNKLR